MKYYSDKLNKLFDTEKELEKAEQEADIKAYKEKQEKEAKAAERKARAAEVEEARKTMVAAQKKYQEVLEAFIRDYKSFHYSIKNDEVKEMIPTLFDIFSPLFFDFK